MKWISVKKERPKIQRKAGFIPLIFSIGKDVCAGRFYGAQIGYRSLQGEWFSAKQITHWMPIPNPPKETP